MLVVAAAAASCPSIVSPHEAISPFLRADIRRPLPDFAHRQAFRQKYLCKSRKNYLRGKSFLRLSALFMKKSHLSLVILLSILASICLLDHSAIRADENPGANAPLAVPPTSPAAQMNFDGTVIVNYAPENGEGAPSEHVSGTTQDGKTDRLPGLQPDQIVGVTLNLGANGAGRTYDAALLDGGALLGVDNGLIADSQGVLRFKFKAGHAPGLYQIALNDGTHEIGLQFWVINEAKPQDNPTVDLPGEGAH